jgi:hypothetical protein
MQKMQNTGCMGIHKSDKAVQEMLSRLLREKNIQNN